MNYEAYRQAIRHELPQARIVVDHFHLVRGANTALDSVLRTAPLRRLPGAPAPSMRMKGTTRRHPRSIDENRVFNRT
jgi:transposase